MADTGADGLDAKEQGVSIAVDAELVELKDVPAGFTLSPEAILGAAKEDHFLSASGLGERIGVHEAEHEHVTRAVVLNNGGDEPAGFCEGDVHESQPPKS